MMPSSSGLSTPSNTVSSVKVGNANLTYKATEFARTRLLQEFELVFKEYVKAVEFAKNRSSFSYQRL